ncbi:MAG: nucleoside triphosphate pyrophosphohydrolase [Bacteroidales bacterium]|nr:nucleoside triphosphate pyrophosphohydrolase [Bacteroidales bacterium]
MKNKEKAVENFIRLLEIMDELREKCPWDKKQTLESLRKLTIEEVYELAQAIDEKNLDELKNELGDLMLHIVFYAKIGEELAAFDMASVLDTINNKLIQRHPHIYGDVKVNNDEDVKRNWEDIKLKNGRKRVLEGVPKGLPAIVKAYRIQEKVRGVGFDWDQREQVWDKVTEEMNELKAEALAMNNKEKIESELGDLLFSIINAARLYDIDPEKALEHTNRKFMKRFNYLEDKTLLKGRSLHDMSLDEMNEIWEEAKKFDE